MFGEVGYSLFGRELIERLDDDIAFAHEFDEFGMIISIFFPEGVDDDFIHGLDPSIESNFIDFW